MMKTNARNNWDPRSANVQQDQSAAYDRLRNQCPVARSEYMNWSLFQHGDVKRVLMDHETFSNRVSSHLSVPNGMDPPEHTAFRAVVDKYYTPPEMERFEPVSRRIAASLIEGLQLDTEIEIMSGFARTFALRNQSAFMGWPAELELPLADWIRKNHEATLARDLKKMNEVAYEFDGYIRELLVERRESRADAPQDNTARLLFELVDGRPLTDDEIVSIARNWTVGELSTIAASVGIILNYLANHPEVQNRLRGDRSLIAAGTDEIQRIQDPLVTSRRLTTRPVEFGGRHLDAGSRITLMWPSANRDETVFESPNEFRLHRNPEDNLVYGAGIHVCPGAPMARLELRVLLEELFDRTSGILPVEGKVPVNAIYPAAGYSELLLRFVP
jgi:cytochrome P450